MAERRPYPGRRLGIKSLGPLHDLALRDFLFDALETPVRGAAPEKIILARGIH